jgi:hypothetical protein
MLEFFFIFFAFTLLDSRHLCITTGFISCHLGPVWFWLCFVKGHLYTRLHILYSLRSLPWNDTLVQEIMAKVQDVWIYCDLPWNRNARLQWNETSVILVIYNVLISMKTAAVVKFTCVEDIISIKFKLTNNSQISLNVSCTLKSHPT